MKHINYCRYCLFKGTTLYSGNPEFNKHLSKKEKNSFKFISFVRPDVCRISSDIEKRFDGRDCTNFSFHEDLIAPMLQEDSASISVSKPKHFSSRIYEMIIKGQAKTMKTVVFFTNRSYFSWLLKKSHIK